MLKRKNQILAPPFDPADSHTAQSFSPGARRPASDPVAYSDAQQSDGSRGSDESLCPGGAAAALVQQPRPQGAQALCLRTQQAYRLGPK